MLRYAVVLVTTLALSNARVYLGDLTERLHQVEGKVYAISCSELVIENFYYDGTGPQVFAYIGNNPANGPSGSSEGVDALVTDKSATFKRFPSRRYQNETLHITLPSSYHMNEINWLSIWCKAFNANFGHIRFAPVNQIVEDVCSRVVYCQGLREGYDVCWSVNNTAGDVQVTLCSNILEKNTFMGFGISKFPTTTSMFNADPTLCWRDDDDKWSIQDYYISAYAQCGVSFGNVLGVCMDTKYEGGVDNLEMTKGQDVDGVACCTFTRPLNSSDIEYDNPISLTGPQAVVWAMGPVNRGIILQHPTGFRAVPNVYVDFGNGSNATVCNKLSTEECCKDRYRVTVEPTTPTSPPAECKPCKNRRNKIPTKRRLVFTIGSSEGRCGYEKLTNSSGGWGIAWYVDGCLIPHLKLERGTEYTFCVLGGDDSSIPSEYHPLYLTSSPVGGYFQNRNAGMTMNETIYAGIDDEDNALFTGPLVIHPENKVTRCCTKKKPKPKCPRRAKIFTWTPTEETPDELYYQCATHFFLGWKISVIDKPSGKSNYRG